MREQREMYERYSGLHRHKSRHRTMNPPQASQPADSRAKGVGDELLPMVVTELDVRRILL